MSLWGGKVGACSTLCFAKRKVEQKAGPESKCDGLVSMVAIGSRGDDYMPSSSRIAGFP